MSIHMSRTGPGGCRVTQLLPTNFSLRFLGVGGKGATLGPVAVLENGERPLLMIDCAPGALEAADNDETVFHDCSVRANPAHSGFVDLLDEYPADLLNRIVCYHYGSENEAVRLEEHGFRVARPGQRLSLPAATAIGEKKPRLVSISR